MSSDFVKLYPSVVIGKSVKIGEFSIIGKPYRLINGKEPKTKNEQTIIEKDCDIGSFVIIGKGSNIVEGCSIEDYSKIETDVKIGQNTKIIYRSQICNNAVIGNNCIIGGFVSERVKVRSRSRIFGSVIHKQLDPSRVWDSIVEKSAAIGSDVFIGFGAKVIGGVNIGNNSYICSGSIVTKDVPSFHIASGVNKVVQYKKWKGSLSKSDFFNK